MECIILNCQILIFIIPQGNGTKRSLGDSIKYGLYQGHSESEIP